MRYREVLSPPMHWYLVAFAVVGSVFLACVFAAGPVVAGVITAVAAAMAAYALVSQRLSIEVDEAGTLHVGRARLEAEFRGAVEPLDADRTRLLMTSGADARAWLATRGFADRGVRVDLDDPADPHPYWLISSRQPRRFAHALGWRPEPEAHREPEALPDEDAPRSTDATGGASA